MERYKWRFQLLMALLVFFASSVLTGFYLYDSQSHSTERSNTSRKYIHSVYHSVIDDLQHGLKYRAYGNLLITGFKDAFIAQDREKLFLATIKRYQTMQEENPSLKIMQFHAPDGRSILRMHDKNKFGDNIAALRPMVQRVHQEHIMQSGFEGGVAGVAYRVIVPYFKEGNEEYIGSVEFGIDIDFISREMKQISGIESFFLLDESRIAAANKKDYPYKVGSYYPIELKPDQYEKLKLFIKENPNFDNKTIEYEDHHYEVIPIKIEGSDGHEMGIFLCLNDITEEFHDDAEIILGSSIITIMLIVLFLGINESIARIFMKRVRFQEEYIETILNSQHNIIVVTDGRTIVYVNNAFLDFLHYPSLEAFKKDYACICDVFESNGNEGYLQPIMDGMTWTEYIIVHQDMEHKAKITLHGKSSIFSVHARRMQYENEERYVVVFTDVTEFNRLATLDQLTQIPNRFEVDKVLSHSYSIAKRYEKTFSILLLDIDHFKKINDTYGHLVGDEVLKSFSALLKHQIRESDMAARWGGEEFMILLPNTTLEPARIMAESLRQRIEVEPFDKVKRVTTSIGVAEYSQGEEIDSLLKRVDEKLYIAKKERNRVIA